MVQAAVSLSFLALGIFTVVDWLRHQERSRGYLALALATLGLTSVLGQLNALTGYRLSALGGLTLVLFMASGYSLLLFRDSFIPLSRRLRVGALVLTVVATAFALVMTLPSDPQQRPTALQSAATTLLVVVWSACVIEPIVRFWMASRHRPAVQRARLRAIAGGYGAIVLILLVAGFGGAAATNPSVQWLFEEWRSSHCPCSMSALPRPGGCAVCGASERRMNTATRCTTSYCSARTGRPWRGVPPSGDSDWSGPMASPSSMPTARSWHCEASPGRSRTAWRPRAIPRAGRACSPPRGRAVRTPSSFPYRSASARAPWWSCPGPTRP